MTTRILYVEGNIDGTVGGSYFVMQDLVQGLDRATYVPIVVFHSDNFVAEQLRQSGVEVVIVPVRTPFVFRDQWLNVLLAPVKKFVNLVRGLVLPTLEYARFLRRWRIDLLNLNNSITRNHPWMLAAFMTRTLCITHEMGINRQYSLLSRVLGRRLKAVICVSHAVRDALRRCNVGLRNDVVVHNAIDLKRYALVESAASLRHKHNIPERAPVIGVVGNIRHWKGQETIVRATAILARHYPDLRCILAGGHTDADLGYMRHLESICEGHGIARNVVFAGFQKNAIDYMNLMDVVAHTSVLPEPFGIVMLEAMSLAKPLVSTTIGGPAEIVVHGQTGLLVHPGDPEVLAEAIASLLADPDSARAMGQLGKQRLMDNFSLEIFLSRTTAVYQDVLRGREVH